MPKRLLLPLFAILAAVVVAVRSASWRAEARDDVAPAVDAATAPASEEERLRPPPDGPAIPPTTVAPSPATIDDTRQLIDAPAPLPSGPLRGRILGPDGRPVDRARVRVTCPIGTSQWTYTHLTDEEGRFSVETGRMELGELSADKNGVGSLWMPIAGRGGDLGDLFLEPYLSIGGRVTGVDGTPLPGVEVIAEGLAFGDPGRRGTTRTDDAGGFQLDDLYAGEYELRVREYQDSDREAWRAAPPTVVTAGTRDAVVVAEGVWAIFTILVPPEFAAWQGIWMEGYAHPLDDGDAGKEQRRFVVRSFPALGPFAAQLAAAGPVEGGWSARANGLPLRRQCFSVAAKDAVIARTIDFTSRLEFGSLRVVVRDPGGRPIPHARVTLEHEWKLNNSVEYEWVLLDEDGRLPAVSPGRFWLRVDVDATDPPSESYVPILHEPLVEILPGEETTVEVLAREIGGRLELTVSCEGATDNELAHDPHDRSSGMLGPISGNLFSMEDDWENLLWFRRWSKNGPKRLPRTHFDVKSLVDPCLRPGRYWIEVNASHHRSAQREVTVTAGAVTRLEIVLPPKHR